MFGEKQGNLRDLGSRASRVLGVQGRFPRTRMMPKLCPRNPENSSVPHILI